jgi:hypothetical protein
MFEFYDDEIRENPERSLFDKNGNMLRQEMSPSERRGYTDSLVKKILTKKDIDRITNEISEMVEIAAPEAAIPEELLREGIHVGNN